MCGQADSATHIGEREGTAWRTFEDSQVTVIPSVDDLITSMRESTYLAPVAVDLEIDDDDAGAIPLKAVITAVQIVYVAVAARKNESPVGCYPYPDCHFDGWLLKSGYDPYDGIIKVHGEIMVQGNSPEIASKMLRFSAPGSLTYLKER